MYRLINTFSNMASLLTLLAIAVDSYRKICLPFRKQLRMHHLRRVVLVILTSALTLATPTLVTSGLHTVDTGIAGVAGKDCATSDALRGSRVPVTYFSLMFVLFGVTSFTFATLYTLILIQTKRHNRLPLLCFFFFICFLNCK